MTLKKYNTIWVICFVCVIASATGFDYVKNGTLLQYIIAGIGGVAALVAIINHFRYTFKLQKEEKEENEKDVHSSMLYLKDT